MSKVGESQEWKMLAAKVNAGQRLSSAENARWYALCRAMDDEWAAERAAREAQEIKRVVGAPVPVADDLPVKRVAKRVNGKVVIEEVVDLDEIGKRTLSKMTSRSFERPEPEPGSGEDYSRHHYVSHVRE